MATAAETQSIIRLIVGMVDAAPGADILAELENTVDSGVTIEELAIAISENPAFSGERGLFPDFLPNVIFAENFMTQLVGSEVTKEVLEAAVDAMTADLNAGTSRGVAMNAAIDSLAASTDSDFADAATALANKTAVAEYYSVNVAQSSAELDDLIAVLDGVDSSATAVATGTAAVDTTVAAGQGLAGLITTLDNANKAKAVFLAEADGDGKATTSTTDVAIAADLVTAETATGAVTGAGSGYLGGSATLQTALIADEVARQAKELSTANKALVTAQNATTGTGSAPGLEAAVLSDVAADKAAAAAVITLGLAAGELTGFIAAYNTANTETLVTNDNANGAYTDGAGAVINYSAVTKSLSIATGLTEANSPGIGALLAGSQANQAAAAANKAAMTAAVLTERAIENLDLDGDGVAALKALTVAMTVINEGVKDKASVAEIDAEVAGLAAIATALDGVVFANADTATTHVQAIATLNDAIDIVAFTDDAAGTIAAHNALTQTALTAGYITAADKTAIDTAFASAPPFTDQGTTDAGQALSLVSLATENASARASTFDAALVTYNGVVNGINNTRADGYTRALTDIGEATRAIATFDKIRATDATAESLAADLAVVTKAITDAEAAFAPAGFQKPQAVDAAVESATAKDDVFIGGTTDSQIILFSGDDVLFVGAAVLNADTKAGANGDDTVTEVWITGTTSAVITVETSVFGSNAVSPETVTITLTGVAAADVLYADGFVAIG